MGKGIQGREYSAHRMNDDIAGMTLTAVATAICRKTLSSLEVTQSVLARADELQPKLNCFISIERDDVSSRSRFHLRRDRPRSL